MADQNTTPFFNELNRMQQVLPIDFFSNLSWIDGRPLVEVIEPYRAKIFEQALYMFDGNRPRKSLLTIRLFPNAPAR
jgi:hypothetical protein